MLEELIEFAVRKGDDGQKIAKLMKHPDRDVDFNRVRLLIENKERIFGAPKPGVVGFSRCRPLSITRANLISVDDIKKEIESE